MAQHTMALVGLSHFVSISEVLTSLVSLLPLSQFPPVFPSVSIELCLQQPQTAFSHLFVSGCLSVKIYFQNDFTLWPR